MPVSEPSVTAPSRRGFLPRGGPRPRPSFAGALAAGGGVIVWIGVLLIASDVFVETGDGWVAALLFVALFALAIVALIVGPREVRPGCVSALVLSVPAIYGYLIFPSVDSFADVRVFFILTIATWALLFLASNARGRPILLGLAAALFYLWMVGEVADTDAYVAAPIPSPAYSTPVALLDGMRGGSDNELAAFVTQETTLDDLDPADPLYPLAEECDGGDLGACDQLWTQSEADSDFEAFAESCGGSPSSTFPCAASTSPDFDVDVDGLGEVPFDAVPLDTDALGSQGDKALEIGIVSLLIGGCYLAAVRLLDRRSWSTFATAFVVPAVGALVIAASALGDASDSAVLGGLLTLAIGVVIGIVGYFGRDRRFTAWAGGAIASVGALIVAADVAPEPNPTGDNADLIGAGVVVLLFGIAVVVLAAFAHHAIEARVAFDHSDAPPEPPPAAPEPDSIPI